MQEADLVAKMLRAVLQSHKDGIPFSYLQGEYKSLTGDWIPFKQLGHPSLEAYLKSVPEVVRIEISRSGEITCHAVACQETARIAQLVARQRTSKKKMGRSVNCRMRLKPARFSLVGKPKCSLRKPGFMSQSEENKHLMLPVLQSRGNHAHFRPGVSTAQYPLSPAFRPENRLVLPPRYQKDLQVHLSKNLSCDSNATRRVTHCPPAASSNININEIQKRIKEILNKFNNGIWLSRISHLYREVYREDLNPALLPHFEHWPHICKTQKVCSGGHWDVLLYPAAKPDHPVNSISSQEGKSQSALTEEPAQHKCAAGHGDLKQNIAAILSNYSSGLWANALPKVYEDTYKAMFPRDVLSHLDSLSDVCTVDYVAGNPQKAILYAKSKRNTENPSSPSEAQVHEDLKKLAEQEAAAVIQEVQEESSENLTVPPLVVPVETSPSVLVVELDNTNEVVIRYVGKDYSAAQELMEDEMKEYYSHNPSVLPVYSLKVGQLVAVHAEEDAWLRAQIIAVEGNRIKVCYVDYGFNESIEITKVFKLAKQFYSLPFQASKCKLAGLEAFCDDPVLVKMVESQTCGKIFAVEILEKSDAPLVVLYDTSGEDDININATCLKTLCDKSLELHLQVNALYTNVRVTNVCSDGTLYCQVPSKGLTKLSECLQKLENYFHHKQAAEASVSLPYCGKICMFNFKGKWARVEITSVHSSRALDVQFMDTGTVASVKVSELKEVPSMFLREIIAIPPQATKCCLADLPLHIGMWTPDAVLWLRDTVLNCPDCSIKVVKLDESHRTAHIYLFTPKTFPDPDLSINRKITNAELWKHQKDVFLSVSSTSSPLGQGKMDLSLKPVHSGEKSPAASVPHVAEPGGGDMASIPPPLPLPKPGEQIDVFVSLACHPGYFVLQPWQEMHSLEVLMEEMLLYYSRADERHIAVEKNKLYAAKVEDKWYRVLIKGALANGLVSVYELDYGKHELVSIQKVQPLPDAFRKLPFQAITAQLAGTLFQRDKEGERS